MRKTLALLLAGFMILTPVLVYAEAAEEAEEAVEAEIEELEEDNEFLASEMEELLKEIEVTGKYVEFDGYKIYIPDQCVEDELEEDSIYSISYSAEDMTVTAMTMDMEGVVETADDMAALLDESEIDYTPVKINGMDGFLYVDAENDQLCVDVVDGTTVVELGFTPASDEDVFAVEFVLIGTLQKVEE